MSRDTGAGPRGRRAASRVPLLASILAVAALAACGAVSAAEGPESLINSLGADSWSERNTAAHELEAMGEDAFPALHRAFISSPDPEVRHRAGMILEKGIFGKLPVQVRESLDGFFGKSASDKQEVLASAASAFDTVGGLELSRLLERIFAYDPDRAGRDAALKAMQAAGLLPARSPLYRALKRADDAWSRVRVGIAFSRNGFANDALSMLVEGANPPEDLSAASGFERARSLSATGEHEEGALLLLRVCPEFDSGLDPDPETGARILALGGKPAESAAFLAGALEKWPEDRAAVLRAEAFAAWLAGTGSGPAAMDLLDRCCKASGFALRARILVRSGKAQEAARLAAATAEQFGPSSQEALSAFAAIVARGAWKEALDALPPVSEAAAGGPLFMVAFDALLAAGRSAEVEGVVTGSAIAAAVAARRPAEAAEYVRKFADHGNRDAALAAADLGLRGFPGSSVLHEARGDLLAESGKLPEAVLAWIEALPGAPGTNARRRLSGKILSSARTAEERSALAATMLSRSEALAEQWRKRMAEVPRWKRNPYDKARAPVLSVLATILAAAGDAEKARGSSNLAFALADGSTEESVAADRLEIEGSIADEFSYAFLSFFATPSIGQVDHEEAVARVGALGEGFLSKLRVPPGPDRGFGVESESLKRYFTNLLSGETFVDDELRVRALEILEERFQGRMKPETLGEVVERAQGAVRVAALGILERRGGEPAAAAILCAMRRLQGDFSWQRLCANALVGMDAPGLSGELYKTASSDSVRAAVLASWLLLERGKADEAAQLAAVASDEEKPDEVRAFAVLALHGSGFPGAPGLFRILSDDPSQRVRMAAAVAIAAGGGRDGFEAVAREAEFGRDALPDSFLDAAATLGGPEIEGALLRRIHADAIPDRECAAAACSGPGLSPKAVLEILDGFPAERTGSADVTGSVFEAVARGAASEAASEALACLGEETLCDGENAVDLSLAARMALRAGRTDRAESLFRRARQGLEFDPGLYETLALARMLLDFGREPELALNAARRLQLRIPAGAESTALLARSLAATGNTKEALRLLDGALSLPPGPGYSSMKDLRARLAR